MKKRRTILFCLLLFTGAALCLCGCGTVTSDEAGEYLDEGTMQSQGNGSGECTIAIDCLTITDNMKLLDGSKSDFVPDDGVILKKTTVAFGDGESVLDILKKVTKENNIQMEFENSPAYDGGYVQGIANLYEYDCGDLSGWEFSVNDWYPNYASGNYIVSDGDVIKWRYTCDNGKDIEKE